MCEKIKKGFCVFHESQCKIIKPEYFDNESQSFRVVVDCNGQKHEPVPNVIFDSKDDWLAYKHVEHSKDCPICKGVQLHTKTKEAGE